MASSLTGMRMGQLTTSDAPSAHLGRAERRAAGQWSKRPKRRTRHSPSLVGAALVFIACLVLIAVGSGNFGVVAQRRQKQQKRPAPVVQNDVSLTSHTRESLSPEAREMVELASNVVCRERARDPKGSVPIDEMQGRPSLPVRSPEAVAGAEHAQRLLPTAKSLVAASLRGLAKDYSFGNSRASNARLQRAIARVEAVRNIRPD